MNSTTITTYADLLEIKYKAAHRNATISGAVFILALAAFFTLGMLGELTGLELFVMAAFLIAFAFALIASLIRRETLAGMRQLCSLLIQNSEPDPYPAPSKITPNAT